MSLLRLENITLREDEPADKDQGHLLKGVSLTVGQGEIVGILGPSGAGKSLLLRTIIGLVQPHEGGIFMGAEEITTLPLRKRGMAYLSQRLVLYPHLSGEENVGFFYWVRGLLKKPSEIRFHPVVREVLEKMHLTESHLLERRPKTMAGGEKQRVALARALASEARVLLLDEPFANIESNFREVLRHFLRDWIRSRGQTALIVSHNQEEMAALCDRLILLDSGQVIQCGTYDDLFFSPTSRLTALFMGLSRKNFFSSEEIATLWGKAFDYDVVMLPDVCREDKSDEWDLEVFGPVIMVENFFSERKKLLCIDFRKTLVFREVALEADIKKGDKVRFFFPLKEAWIFERSYPYRRMYQGVWE